MSEKGINTIIAKQQDEEKFNPLFAAMTQEIINETLSDTKFDENLCFSPISLYYSLSALAFGCAGKTLDSLLTSLGYNSVADFMNDVRERKENIEDSNEGAWGYVPEQIKILTSILVNSANESGLNAKAKGHAQAELGALVAAADFSDHNTAKMVSDWCNSETDGFLSPNINIANDDPLFIASLFYYCGRWVDEFYEEEFTKNKNFHTPNGKVKVPFMRVDDTKSYIFRGDGFTAASRSLGFCKMTFFLPNKGTSLEKMLCGDGKIAHLLSASQDKPAHIKWRVPKFDISSQIELEDCCRALGIDDVFTPANDIKWLEGTPRPEQYVSGMEQDTRIAIDEDGCKAASLTAMHLRGACLEPPRPIVRLKLNRPFAFALETKSSRCPSELLVFGVVNDPSKS